MSFLDRFFPGESPKRSARERLQLVLIHDRTDISPATLERLREDLIHVISDYMVISEEGIDLDLERDGNSVALVASIPVLEVKRKSSRDIER
ncbi:MAG TPA: cell division topological specificity factor MinE [Synergistales bacterium]|jgi:cell division topological specificity factor|nr:cell division topological specificity factor MinE [Synergistales bacterium]